MSKKCYWCRKPVTEQEAYWEYRGWIGGKKNQRVEICDACLDEKTRPRREGKPGGWEVRASSKHGLRVYAL